MCEESSPFKVDFEKAYEHVERISGLGVAQEGVWVLMEVDQGCFSSRSVLVIVNGKARKSSRLLRVQGKLIRCSPFFVCFDSKGRMVDMVKEMGLVDGFGLGRSRVCVSQLEFFICYQF